MVANRNLGMGGRTVHESIGEDHDGVVEVSVLLSDHAERRPLLLL